MGDEEEELSEVGNARYTTTSYGMVQSLEKNTETEKLVRTRAQLDVRILQAAKMMRLRYSEFDHSSFHSRGDEGEEVSHPPPLYAPDSGGRFLGTGPKCVPQRAHCDFMWYDDVEGTHECIPCPGYFAIVTGSSSSALWVARGSHRLVGLTDEDKKDMAELRPMEKVVIPPFSILYGRGDLTHAGPGFDDFDSPSGAPHNVRLRYHLYLCREDVPLGDAISYFANYTPVPDPAQRPQTTKRRPKGKTH